MCGVQVSNVATARRAALCKDVAVLQHKVGDLSEKLDHVLKDLVTIQDDAKSVQAAVVDEVRPPKKHSKLNVCHCHG